MPPRLLLVSNNDVRVRWRPVSRKCHRRTPVPRRHWAGGLPRPQEELGAVARPAPRCLRSRRGRGAVRARGIPGRHLLAGRRVLHRPALALAPRPALVGRWSRRHLRRSAWPPTSPADRAVDVSLGFGLANTTEAVVAGLILTAGLTPARAAERPGRRAAAAAPPPRRAPRSSALIAGGGRRTRAGTGDVPRRRCAPPRPRTPPRWSRSSRSRSSCWASAGAGGRASTDRPGPGPGSVLSAADLLAHRHADHRPAAAGRADLGGAPAAASGVLTLELAGFAIVVSLLTAEGRGPVRRRRRRQRSTSALAAGAAAQLYLLCTAVITLPLAVASLQSQHAPRPGPRRRAALPPQLHRVAGRHGLPRRRGGPRHRRRTTRTASTCASSTSTTPPSGSSAATATSWSTARCSSWSRSG